MTGFGERNPEDTGDGFGDRTECPVCAEEGSEHAIRSHLLNAHGWSQQQVDEEFTDPELTKVSGPSEPVSDRDTTPAYGTPAGDDGPVDEPIDKSQYTEVESEHDLCDCDPKHKETQTVQQKKGGKLGPIGGQHGDGTTVIICTKCGGRFYEDDGGFGSDILPGPGPF
ncbi:hypothetical protein NDI54_02135 [Haloarcula sp. S1AR25-5A]|uniref:Uncharacterized protein n=1 Tax=Haloarcula terrestris TaxID=2950533 RepID=A0AAE4JFB9_9EURY|nr:hypothetical protein [Haloarcula terrestris]MDS0220143.1 hypothetical protein [Haloarcula terrestris]